MRVDTRHHILGMRLNDWTAIVVFVGAVVYLVLSARMRPGREEAVEPVPAVDAGRGGGRRRRHRGRGRRRARRPRESRRGLRADAAR